MKKLYFHQAWDMLLKRSTGKVLEYIPSDYHLLYSLLSNLGWDVFQDSYASTVYLQWKCLELDLRVNLDTFSNYSKIESGHFVMVITLTKLTPIELVLTQFKPRRMRTQDD